MPKIHEDRDLESFEKTIFSEDTGTERKLKSCRVIGMLEDLVEGCKGLKVGWHARPSRTLPRKTPAWERGMWSNGKSKKKKFVRDLGNRRGI